MKLRPDAQATTLEKQIVYLIFIVALTARSYRECHVFMFGNGTLNLIRHI